MLTKEEREKNIRATQAKYALTEKGKAVGKKAQKKYNVTAKRKITMKLYEASEKGKQRRRKFNNSFKGTIYTLYSGARHRAKKHNREFSITKEWLEKKVKKGVCEVTGVPFEYDNKKEYKSAPFIPSLDRKNRKIGYTPRNTQVVINAYNIMKWEWSKKDLKKLIEIVKNKL